MKSGSLFAQARVAHNTVVWNEDVDIAPESLYLEVIKSNKKGQTTFNGRKGVRRLMDALPDEADNHLVELALAGGAAGIVTHNVWRNGNDDINDTLAG